MQVGFRKDGDEGASCPQLLDLFSEQREWKVRDGGGGDGYGAAEDEQLELKLGPPVHEDSSSILSLGLFPRSSKNTINLSSGAKRGFFHTLGGGSDYQKHQQQQKSGFLHSNKKPDGREREKQEATDERKAKAPLATVTRGNAPATHSNNQSRTAAAPVVGWPPIRSFRKNIASSSLKPPSKDVLEATQKPENCTKNMFVKINMDGIPIGRKINLKAYQSYEDLSAVVDELFRGLLAADKNAENSPSITGLLDGKGEYTLVYVDDGGDRMLVGDVPWKMFVSTAKRLRVLKTSELSSFIPRSDLQ